MAANTLSLLHLFSLGSCNLWLGVSASLLTGLLHTELREFASACRALTGLLPTAVRKMTSKHIWSLNFRSSSGMLSFQKRNMKLLKEHWSFPGSGLTSLLTLHYQDADLRSATGLIMLGLPYSLGITHNSFTLFLCWCGEEKQPKWQAVCNRKCTLTGPSHYWLKMFFDREITSVYYSSRRTIWRQWKLGGIL